MAQQGITNVVGQLRGWIWGIRRAAVSASTAARSLTCRRSGPGPPWRFAVDSKVARAGLSAELFRSAAEGSAVMVAFQDNFQPDPESDGSRRLWRTAKPLFRGAVVAVAPPYPEYPKLSSSKVCPRAEGLR